MTLLVPDVGEAEMLTRILKDVENSVLKLYTNDHSPAEADTVSAYSEASGNGYAEKVLTKSSWSVATSAGTTEGDYAQQTWTFTGALGNVYGYYITNAAETTLLWAERFTDGPYNIQNNGDQIKVTPKIQLA